MSFQLKRGEKTMLIIKNDKAYSSKNIAKTELVSSCTWIPQKTNYNFLLPKKTLYLNSKDALDITDLFEKVYINNDCGFIHADKNFNTEVYIDFIKQKINFVACKDIKKDEQITFSYHSSCFNNAKIQ